MFFVCFCYFSALICDLIKTLHGMQPLSVCKSEGMLRVDRNTREAGDLPGRKQSRSEAAVLESR